MYYITDLHNAYVLINNSDDQEIKSLFDSSISRSKYIKQTDLVSELCDYIGNQDIIIHTAAKNQFMKNYDTDIMFGKELSKFNDIKLHKGDFILLLVELDVDHNVWIEYLLG